MDNALYTVQLRADQWDSVVICLERTRRWAADSVITGEVDRMCRKITRKRLAEVIAEIQSNVPEAGADD